MARKHGSLTLYSHDGSEIYGEFAEASWAQEDDSHGGTNHIFSCVATEGSFDAVQQINSRGIEHVSYRFDAEDGSWAGDARLLAWEHADAPARAVVKIEALAAPAPR